MNSTPAASKLYAPTRLDCFDFIEKRVCNVPQFCCLPLKRGTFVLRYLIGRPIDANTEFLHAVSPSFKLGFRGNAAFAHIKPYSKCETNATQNRGPQGEVLEVSCEQGVSQSRKLTPFEPAASA
jgi:hypothetical protein